MLLIELESEVSKLITVEVEFSELKQDGATRIGMYEISEDVLRTFKNFSIQWDKAAETLENLRDKFNIDDFLKRPFIDEEENDVQE